MFGNFNRPSTLPSLNTSQTQSNAQQQPQNANPFGQSTQSAPFGMQNQQQQPVQMNQQQPLGQSLFGAQNQQQPGQMNQQQPQGSSLFGTQNQQQQQNPFGQSTQQQPQQQQQPQGLSLFGTQNQQQQQNPFGQSTQQQPQQPQQPQQQQQPSLFSGLGASRPAQQSLGGSTFGATQPQNQLQGSLGASSLWQPGSTLSPREKTVPEQMQVLLEKWSPESPNCAFQRFFYNHVQTDTVPYYGPLPGEDESKWEEALSNRPSEGDIPVLCRGFASLGNRLRVQVEAVSALQQRMHEIHNSLTSMLQIHELDISVRTSDAKRRHIALSQRCIQLATKVQILQNRGYALDESEEELKKKLTQLDRKTFDPQLNGRQEEIWARMVGVRERARFLQEETEKAGAALADAKGEEIDDGVMKQAKKLLDDFDKSISRLNTDVKDIQKEFDEWEKGGSSDRQS